MRECLLSHFVRIDIIPHLDDSSSIDAGAAVWRILSAKHDIQFRNNCSCAEDQLPHDIVNRLLTHREFLFLLRG